jgi:predicted dehydrogenase
MVSKLRAGVVGAGVFGGYHATKYAERCDVELVAILDSHPERARTLADRFGARSCSGLEEMLERVDVVSICAPAHAHAALALACLAASRSMSKNRSRPAWRTPTPSLRRGVATA